VEEGCSNRSASSNAAASQRRGERAQKTDLPLAPLSSEGTTFSSFTEVFLRNPTSSCRLGTPTTSQQLSLATEGATAPMVASECHPIPSGDGRGAPEPDEPGAMSSEGGRGPSKPMPEAAVVSHMGGLCRERRN
jgi:hypothetical protein